MKLYVLFEQPDENYPGQYAPVALTVLDEYTIDNLGMGIIEAQKQEVLRLFQTGDLNPEHSNQFAWLEIDLGTTEQLIRDTILQPTPTIQGLVAVPAPPQGQKHPSYEAITVTRGRPGAPGVIVDDEIVE